MVLTETVGTWTDGDQTIYDQLVREQATGQTGQTYEQTLLANAGQTLAEIQRYLAQQTVQDSHAGLGTPQTPQTTSFRATAPVPYHRPDYGYRYPTRLHGVPGLHEAVKPLNIDLGSREIKSHRRTPEWRHKMARAVGFVASAATMGAGIYALWEGVTSTGAF